MVNPKTVLDSDWFQPILPAFGILIVYTGDDSRQIAKHSNVSNGADPNNLNSYAPLPHITPRSYSTFSDHQAAPIVVKTSATPRDPSTREPTNQMVQHNKQFLSADWESSDNKNYDEHDLNAINQSNHNVRQSRQDVSVSYPHSDSAPNVDPPQNHLASSPRRQQPRPQEYTQSRPQEEYLSPLSATPPNTDSENHKNSKQHHGYRGNQHKHDEDSGIAGFTPDTYKGNDPLDR